MATLSQNVPNPVYGHTRIAYHLEQNAHVVLSIYSIEGKKISVLVNEDQNEGAHSIEWNGTLNNGMKLEPGIYVYSLETNNFMISKRLVLLK